MAYFDQNNSFELVTKVQTQIENIECGLGDKFGFVIQKIFTVISGLVISFLVNFKLSLIIFTLSPITIFLIFYFTSTLKKSAKIVKSAYEKAGITSIKDMAVLQNASTPVSADDYKAFLEGVSSKIVSGGVLLLVIMSMWLN